MAEFANIEDEVIPEEDLPVLSVPEGGEDWDGAQAAKDAAGEALASGNYEQAVESFTRCLELGSISAITLAKRADCLLKLRRPLAALSDCDAALAINPDSAKALKCRGHVNRFLGRWEASVRDLAASQAIDFDPDLEDIRKAVTAKASEVEAAKVEQRLAEEEILREKVKKQREEMAQRRKEEEEEEARRQAEAAAGGGMPGGMPGGMGGEGIQQLLMQMLMSDPELAAGIQNPKIMKAFSGMMSGGDPKDLEDPEVQAFMAKFQEKMGPMMGMMGGGMGGMPGGMGGMGGMPGGMGGMPGGMGGMGGAAPAAEEPSAPSVEEVD